MIVHSSILQQRWELPVQFTFGEKTIFSDLSVIIRCNTNQHQHLLAKLDQLIQQKATSMGYDVQNIEADAIVTECSSVSPHVWEFEFVYEVKQPLAEPVYVTASYINFVNSNSRQPVGAGSPRLSLSKLMNTLAAGTQEIGRRLRDSVQLVYSRIPRAL